MKRLLFTSCAVLALLLSFNSSSFAQDGRIQIGPGLAYGSEAENLGISVDGYYTINEQFRAGAAITYYFPKDDINQYTINLNGNYIFYNEDQLMAYGIAGINIYSWSWDTDIEGIDVDDSGSEVGLNLGAGVEYALDFANLFGELKFAGIGGDADQLVLGGGLRFDI